MSSAGALVDVDGPRYLKRMRMTATADDSDVEMADRTSSTGPSSSATFSDSQGRTHSKQFAGHQRQQPAAHTTRPCDPGAAERFAAAGAGSGIASQSAAESHKGPSSLGSSVPATHYARELGLGARDGSGDGGRSAGAGAPSAASGSSGGHHESDFAAGVQDLE